MLGLAPTSNHNILWFRSFPLIVADRTPGPLWNASGRSVGNPLLSLWIGP